MTIMDEFNLKKIEEDDHHSLDETLSEDGSFLKFNYN